MSSGEVVEIKFNPWREEWASEMPLDMLAFLALVRLQAAEDNPHEWLEHVNAAEKAVAAIWRRTRPEAENEDTNG